VGWDSWVGWRALSDHQRLVAGAFLEARQTEHDHLVIYLSGAHAYGFPSPDSDLDLKCVHLVPTRDLVGLSPSPEPTDQVVVHDGVELDYGSNELVWVLRGVLKGNGNFVERIFGELVLGGDPVLLARAREVVAPAFSRRFGRHYGGFALGQLRMFDERPTAKRALYVLRTAATGRHLLQHGAILTDVHHLGEFVPREIIELIEIKRTAEQQLLPPTLVEAWRGRLVAAVEAVDRAIAQSILPAEPPAAAVATIEAWLREVRRARW
jgi:uncharacterized protein